VQAHSGIEEGITVTLAHSPVCLMKHSYLQFSINCTSVTVNQSDTDSALTLFIHLLRGLHP